MIYAIILVWILSGLAAYAFLIRGRDEYFVGDIVFAFPFVLLGPLVAVVLMVGILLAVVHGSLDKSIWKRKKR
jgi:hypothetical protein